VREEVRDERYWLRLADENRRQGLYENSLRLYSRALEQDKSLVEGWVGQVQMLILLDEYPEAEMWGRKALELFRNHPDLLAGRAQALCRSGDRSKAQGLCDAASSQPGNSSYPWIARGEMMIAAGQDMDRYCFDKATQLNPDWLVGLEISLVYRHYSQAAKALPYIRRVVERAPQSPYAWYLQGCFEDDLGFTAGARKSLARSLELVPGYADASRRLSKINNRGWSVTRPLRRLLQSFRMLRGK
jgi:tetratricopeptide (TPR) repeat protein